MRTTFRLTALCLLLSAVPFTPALFAASGDTALPTGNLTVEQEKFMDHTTNWTLINTEELKLSSSEEEKTAQIPASQYTFFVDQPKGYITTIRLFRGTTLLQTVDTPQLVFSYDGQGDLRIEVSFTLTYFGKVSVVSTPAGVPFELRGPNQLVLTGDTPASYEQLPIGLYSVRFLPQGCAATPPKSDQLQYESRVDFSVSINCDKLEIKEAKDAEDKKFVSTSTQNGQIVFRDVPNESWFAPYVTTVARRGIMAGYRNDDGTPSDRFGPENPVTLAQLAKIAHEAMGIDESSVSAVPANRSASGWCVPYIASAEARDWVVFTSSGTDVNRPATRGEVVVTLLQAMDLPLAWPKGSLFSDVSRRTPYAAAIETAAKEGFVAGKAGADGILTGAFGPEDSINRAELAKIITQVISKHAPQGAVSSSSSR